MVQQLGDWEEPQRGVLSVVPFIILLRERLSVVLSEREAALLLETGSRANRKSSNNSKNRSTGKVLSYNGRERNFRE